MATDELEPRPEETPEVWVQRITPLLRKEFQRTTDPAARLRMAQILAQVLDVPVSNAFLYLRSNDAPDTRRG